MRPHPLRVIFVQNGFFGAYALLASNVSFAKRFPWRQQLFAPRANLAATKIVDAEKLFDEKNVWRQKIVGAKICFGVKKKGYVFSRRALQNDSETMALQQQVQTNRPPNFRAHKILGWIQSSRGASQETSNNKRKKRNAKIGT